MVSRMACTTSSCFLVAGLGGADNEGIDPVQFTWRGGHLCLGDGPQPASRWSARSAARTNDLEAGETKPPSTSRRRWLPGTARSPTSAGTFTTNKPAPSSRGMTLWWWRIYRSPTWCGGRSPSQTRRTRGSFCPAVPGRSPGLIGVSVTLAGVSSSRFCAPKRKMLGVSGLRSTPGTPRTAARTADMHLPRIASPKRNSNASNARIARRQMSMPHATSSGLDWPVTPKRREKKPAASSRRRSHAGNHK